MREFILAALLAALACAAFLVGCIVTERVESREAEYLDLLRRVESVQWRQGDEVGRECPICFGDKEHLDGCELAEVLAQTKGADDA